MRLVKYSSVCFLIVWSIVAVAYAGDYQKATSLYTEGCALLNQNPEQAEKLLVECVAEIPSFRGYFALGSAQMQIGKFALSYESFKQAMKYQPTVEEKSLAMGKMAQVMALEGDTYRAVQLLKEAEELHPTPPEWMGQMRKQLDISNLDKVVDSATISQSLADSKAFSPVGKKPGIKLQINFQTNKATLDSKGWQQIEKLAAAIGSERFSKTRFSIVGHTDIRGDVGQNQILSERRAQTVVHELVNLNQKLEGRLQAEGKGEVELLYKDMDEDSHSLNRRVEVEILN